MRTKTFLEENKQVKICETKYVSILNKGVIKWNLPLLMNRQAGIVFTNLIMQ